MKLEMKGLNMKIRKVNFGDFVLVVYEPEEERIDEFYNWLSGFVKRFIGRLRRI